MRKLVLIWIGCGVVLSGCFRPAAASVVEDMYQKALLEETEQVFHFFSEAFLKEHSEEELLEEVLTQVREVGGLKLLNATEVGKSNLNSKLVATLDQEFEDDWHVIANDAANDLVMVWVVVRTPTHYEIVHGRKMHPKDYQENITNLK